MKLLLAVIAAAALALCAGAAAARTDFTGGHAPQDTMSCEKPQVVLPAGAAPLPQGATLIAQDKSKGVTWLVAVPPSHTPNAAPTTLAVALPFEAGNHETAMTQDGALEGD